jgi:hypothetical protein
MKKINITIRVVAMMAFCLTIFGSVMLSKAADTTKEEQIQKCAADIVGVNENTYMNDQMLVEYNKLIADMKNSPYADWDKSPATIIGDYHENINKKFNEYIKKMIDNGDKCAGVTDEKSPCVINSSAPPRNKDGTPGTCSADNFSTYCVAATLYSDPSIGYKTMRDIMSCRKYEMFETAKEGKLFFSPLMTDSASQQANNNYQEQKAVTVGTKVQVITDKVLQAKKVLDQTLSAYDQLRLAWSMHKKYIQIYNSLIKYRDLLKEIRRAVETFPSKFIDASSTKCV